MKRWIIIGFLLTVFLTGCADKTIIPEKGDFSFELPDGYSVASVTDKDCSIIRDEDSAVVGGIEITELKIKDLKGENTENIMLYLQSDFHMTNDVEFIASYWGDKHPIVRVDLSRHGDGTEEKCVFLHTLFEKDFGVYHMWFDMNVMDPEIESQFITITGVD